MLVFCFFVFFFITTIVIAISNNNNYYIKLNLSISLLLINSIFRYNWPKYSLIEKWERPHSAWGTVALWYLWIISNILALGAVRKKLLQISYKTKIYLLALWSRSLTWVNNYSKWLLKQIHVAVILRTKSIFLLPELSYSQINRLSRDCGKKETATRWGL